MLFGLPPVTGRHNLSLVFTLTTTLRFVWLLKVATRLTCGDDGEKNSVPIVLRRLTSTASAK
ncbi:CLUMA_CG005389, isoform A [Clunio marinus]|uniref:CLUMA_CG005389, isoform A n=1 Tax=Clunio marinus TaxID=568069 RepID=A0A1J1HUS8_9DIPT|nr:CLUMA_CG005389, isoform A [Clunio marinus]